MTNREATTNSEVNHPKHYTSGLTSRPLECIDVSRYLPFALGNAVKYVWRAGLKGDKAKAQEDLEKAHWYLEDWSIMTGELTEGAYHAYDSLRSFSWPVAKLLEPGNGASMGERLKVEIIRRILTGCMDDAMELLEDLEEVISAENENL